MDIYFSRLWTSRFDCFRLPLTWLTHRRKSLHRFISFDMPNLGIFSITRANLKVFTVGNDRNPIKDLLAGAQTLRRCFSFDWKLMKGPSWATWTLPKPSISTAKQYKQKWSFCTCTVLSESDPVKAERWVPSVFFSQHRFLPLIFLHFFSNTPLNRRLASLAWFDRSGL